MSSLFLYSECTHRSYPDLMPWSLLRFQQTGDIHFITFSCYRRRPLLQSSASRDYFEATLEHVRRWYGLCIIGYVVMPEHVHLLLTEPERRSLAIAIQMLKQVSGRKLAIPDKSPFWQRRYYDRNVRGTEELYNALNYIHYNPVKRGLAEQPSQWRWSSCRHHLTGDDGVIEIESVWTERKRERMAIVPTVSIMTEQKSPTLSQKTREG
jgi:REP-associated tyrosine transposase